jgi:hypothetical protein
MHGFLYKRLKKHHKINLKRRLKRAVNQDPNKTGGQIRQRRRQS